MESPCKLILFGDSITKGYAPRLEQILRSDYQEVDLDVVNAGISGETSRVGLQRLPKLIAQKPDVAVIGFGMNDWRKGVERKEFKKNLIKMLEAFEDIGTRVIINTVPPSYDFQKHRYNYHVDDYSEAVREIAYEKRIKIADINALWKRELRKPQKALRDDIHPNSRGYDLICKSLMGVVPRRNTTVLWQYNGREAKCNYGCPYCYYIGLHSPKDRFTGYIEQWHERFLEAFGKQHLVFYLAFGEPTIGSKFLDILNMVGEEPNWELRITSNVSSNIEKIVNSTPAKEGRVNINASFHPCMTKRQTFLGKLIYFRDHGIEPSIVYVAYPTYLSHFIEDIYFFRSYGFIVHVRRFQGTFKNKIYPWAYTDEERRMIASFSDDGMIKYMLNQQVNKNCLTYSGLHFFVCDNAGNIGYDSNAFGPYTKLRNVFGNIHTGNFRPTLLPTNYPGICEGTVDGVANLVYANYKELTNNNILSFSKQGGVYKAQNGKVVYGNEFKNFDDPKIRAKYNFPPRDIQDYFAIMRYSKAPVIRQSLYRKAYSIASNIAENNPGLKNIAKKILRK